MIVSIHDKLTQDIFDGVQSRHIRRLDKSLHAKARRLLDQINAAPDVNMLRVTPGNRLEKLSGDLKDQWSVRLNDQWRIVFKWIDNNAHDVCIIDYHK
ncbi:MAG: type II toxin-antitoxin system RelE/ParE family toxin [Deltaproteobacteria bacterium]|nr:type II toxin-antitoxin system RelE/ParE family toxin [Deltaproteobacteria bacterium]